MPLRRREVELSVERALGRGGDASEGVARLTARFDVDGDGPTPEELQQALDRLREEIGRLAVFTARPDRSVEELVETYRPRQPELIELLRDEGEITPSEFDRLRAHLAGVPAAAPEPAPPKMLAPTVKVGVPERPGGSARSVDDLLRQYRIESLRQAGVVRARREISFDEYMALKRHFEGPSGPK